MELALAVPWGKSEDDPKMGGKRLKSEVVTVDKYREKLETEEHVPLPKRVYRSRENVGEFGFTARCPGCVSLLRGTARQAHTENCRRRIEEELKSTAKADAATRRTKEYQDRAAEKGTKRTKTDQEEGQQQCEHGESTARMEEDAPSSSSSGSGDVAPTQSSSSSSSATKMSGHEGGDGCNEGCCEGSETNEDGPGRRVPTARHQGTDGEDGGKMRPHRVPPAVEARR